MRGFALVGIIGMVCSLPVTPSLAGSNEADAKAACTSIGTMLRDQKFEDMVNFIVAASHQLMSPTAVSQLEPAVRPWFGNGGQPEGPTFLVEKNYADTLHRAWYLLMNNGKLLFLKCESVRMSGTWVLDDFQVGTDSTKVALP